MASTVRKTWMCKWLFEGSHTELRTGVQDLLWNVNEDFNKTSLRPYTWVRSQFTLLRFLSHASGSSTVWIMCHNDLWQVNWYKIAFCISHNVELFVLMNYSVWIFPKSKTVFFWHHNVSTWRDSLEVFGYPRCKIRGNRYIFPVG